MQYKMENLEIHSKGSNAYWSLIKEQFESFKQSLIKNSTMTKSEKEIELSKARKILLEEKKQLNDKLF